MKKQTSRDVQTAVTSDTATAPFEKQVARDWRLFKEKYFACTEYPAVRQALKKILVAEEKEMAVNSVMKESAQ
ncbi:MAG: hypothetical protein FJ284_12765 [Planctomycetes bacterium]|nr:hypothetical protein [Planctomycetota bacterium]